MAVVMVGAMLVSGVETIWNRIYLPPFGNDIVPCDRRGRGIVLERFAEIGRFNYGCTVVVLWPKGAVALDATLGPEVASKVGQALGRTVDLSTM